MQKTASITRVEPMSVAKVAAFYYGFWGVIAAAVYAITDSETWLAPLGFWAMFLRFTINLKYALHPGIGSVAIQMLLTMLAFCCSGWLTGLVCAFAYNFLSQKLGLYVRGTTIEEESPR